MKFSFNASGANAPLIMEYDIAANTAIYAGEAVGVKNGLIVKASAATTLLGVAAEDHSGVEEFLNPRANGEVIRVNIAADAVYEVKAPRFTAKSGTATTLVTETAALSTAVTSGRAILVAKAANSANSDEIGSARRISACAISGANATLTLASGGVPAAGDEYMLLPDVGTELYLDASGTGAALYAAGSTVKLYTVCTDATRGTIGVAFKSTLLR